MSLDYMTMFADDNADEYVMLYGFENSDPTHTAYLRIGTSKELGIYYVEESEKFATHFRLCRRRWTPKRLVEFFSSEDDLCNWTFHPVIRRFKKTKKGR